MIILIFVINLYFMFENLDFFELVKQWPLLCLHLKVYLILVFNLLISIFISHQFAFEVIYFIARVILFLELSKDPIQIISTITQVIHSSIIWLVTNTYWRHPSIQFIVILIDLTYFKDLQFFHLYRLLILFIPLITISFISIFQFGLLDLKDPFKEMIILIALSVEIFRIL